MPKFLLAFLLATLGPTYAYSQSEPCRACIRDKLAGTGEQVAVATAIGALGGLAVGSLPGAVCGAVLAAVGTSISSLINVAQCDQVCREEAQARSDPNANRCEDMANRARGR